MQTILGAKPRLSYSAFIAAQNPQPQEPQSPDFAPQSVAWLLERYYTEFRERIGLSQRYTIRRLQASPNIGIKQVRELTKANIFDHAKARLAGGVKPQTVQMDLTYLRVALKYAGSAWADCEGISDKAVTDALPFMKAHDLVCKSVPRDRLPMPEEIASLRAHYRKQAQHRNTKLPMELIMDWQIASGRRIGETCKLLWEDWSREAQTIVVRKMKANKEPRAVALTDEAQAMLVELYEKRDPQQPRIFAYNDKSVGASYTRAKNELGIIDLRLHDSRAATYTRMREKGIPGAVAILVTGHRAEALPERVYKRMKADRFKELQHVRAAA